MDAEKRGVFLVADLPEEVRRLIDGVPLRENHGCSGAQTFYFPRDGGMYLKTAPSGSLERAWRMQAYFAEHGLSSPVVLYVSGAQDWMVTAALPGEDGTSPRCLADPERLCTVFGAALRQLHETDAADCPVRDRMEELSAMASASSFSQAHLDRIARYIGAANAAHAPAEIAAGRGCLENHTLIHGDACLPNILLRDWQCTGFIDMAEGGLGDRHYDLAWGLWTLDYNLGPGDWGAVFLDAYGRDAVDPERLRVCGLLAAMESPSPAAF